MSRGTLLEMCGFFGTSEPVFKLATNSDGSDIRISAPIKKYDAVAAVESANIVDPIMTLLAESYREDLNIEKGKKGKFVVDPHRMADVAMSNVRQSFANFLECNLDNKKPTQTALYKWFDRNLPNSDEFNEIALNMYRYMRSFSNSEMRSSSEQHTKNTIAILEAIMEKYGKGQKSNNKRRY